MLHNWSKGSVLDHQNTSNAHTNSNYHIFTFSCCVTYINFVLMGTYYVKPHLVCRSTHRIKHIILGFQVYALRCVCFWHYSHEYHYLLTQFTLHIVASKCKSCLSNTISIQRKKQRYVWLNIFTYTRYWWKLRIAFPKKKHACTCVLKLKSVMCKTHMKTRGLYDKENKYKCVGTYIFEENDESFETPKIKGKCGAIRIVKKVRCYFDGKLFAAKLGRACMCCSRGSAVR